MGIEDAQNHAVRPQFPGNHNVASPGLKLFQAVRKSPPPGRIITCSPAEILDRINSITPALGVTPPSSKLLHSSNAARSAPLRGDRRNHRVDATFNQDLFAHIHPAPSIGRRSRRQTLGDLASPGPSRVPRTQNATDFLPGAA
jgi:hypothetical protein